jgi:hypothetical protein
MLQLIMRTPPTITAKRRITTSKDGIRKRRSMLFPHTNTAGKHIGIPKRHTSIRINNSSQRSMSQPIFAGSYSFSLDVT